MIRRRGCRWPHDGELDVALLEIRSRKVCGSPPRSRRRGADNARHAVDQSRDSPVARFSRTRCAILCRRVRQELELADGRPEVIEDATLRLSKARPCGVGTTPWGTRSSSRTPTTCSNSAIASNDGLRDCELLVRLCHAAAARHGKQDVEPPQLEPALICPARCMPRLF